MLTGRPAQQAQLHSTMPATPGAGKTYTMTGDRSAYQQRGLIPRTVSALIAALRTEPGLASWQLRVSYLEVTNMRPMTADACGV